MSFSWTSDIIGWMIVYMVVAAISDRLVFVWEFAVCAILFVFIIECIADLITWLRDRK